MDSENRKFFLKIYFVTCQRVFINHKTVRPSSVVTYISLGDLEELLLSEIESFLFFFKYKIKNINIIKKKKEIERLRYV